MVTLPIEYNAAEVACEVLRDIQNEGRTSVPADEIASALQQLRDAIWESRVAV